MPEISQDAVTEGIGGALERLNASHQAVKQAAAAVYAEGAAPPPAAPSGQTPNTPAGGTA